MSAQRGIALILVILVTSFLSAIGLGLAMIVIMDRLATGNLRGSVAMLHAADAAIELVARDLVQLPDWDLALTGAVTSAIVDGSPSGVRAIPGRRRDRPHDRHEPTQLRQVATCCSARNGREHGRAALGREQRALAALCLRPTWKFCALCTAHAVLHAGVGGR